MPLSELFMGRLFAPCGLLLLIVLAHGLTAYIVKHSRDFPVMTPTQPPAGGILSLPLLSRSLSASTVQERPSDTPRWRPGNSSILNLRRTGWPVPFPLDPDTRYLSYLAHSGFHNQRLALTNALTIAFLTGRTLLVPPISLGSAVAWVPPPLLQAHIEQAEHSDMRACRKTHLRERKEKCGLFWKSRRASWSWLLGPDALARRQPLIERPYHDRSWFKTALNIEDSEIFSVPDPDRRSYRIIDTDGDDSASEKYQYSAPFYVDDLLELSNFKLLEFGSLFGGTRLRLRKPENRKFYHETQALMVYRDPMLEAMSEAISERLGGRQSYVGLHLRLGSPSAFVSSSDAFHGEASDRTEVVFRVLCSEQYGLDAGTISHLLIQNQPRSPEMPILLKPSDLSNKHYLSSSFACDSALYPAQHPLAALNTPLYVATDAANPRDDPLTALFRNTFPCIFFGIHDFYTVNSMNKEPIEELAFLRSAVDPNGERWRPFLEAFVEAEVVAKARGVVAPNSTFSAFVASVLHEAHLPAASENLLFQKS